MSDTTREITLTSDDIDALAAKLDSLDLTDDERALMLAMFQLAGDALGGQSDEVSGFSFDDPVALRSFPGSLGSGFTDSFSSGVGLTERPGPKVSGEIGVKVKVGGGK